MLQFTDDKGKPVFYAPCDKKGHIRAWTWDHECQPVRVPQYDLVSKAKSTGICGKCGDPSRFYICGRCRYVLPDPV